MQKLISIFISILYCCTATAQCPAISNYNPGNGGSSSCPGVSSNPIDADMVSPYDTIPAGTKSGNFTCGWGSNIPITPAISAFYVGTTLLNSTVGPASPLTNNSGTYEADFCVYGSGNMPTNTNITVIFVNPYNSATLYSCAYSIAPNGNATSISPPSISSQPSSQSVCIGGSASLSISASAINSGTLSYQWRKNGVNISGATSSSYTISPFSASDTGLYDVIVSESTGGVIYSDAATLSLYSGKEWLGNSSNWADTSNWTNATLPTSTDDVVITNCAGTMPIITAGTAGMNNITISSGASLTVNGGTLQIADSIINNGSLIINGGTIEYNGTSVQTIASGTFNNNNVSTLKINNSNGVVLSDTLNINVSLLPTSGTLTTNGLLVLKSTSSSTAYIGSYSGCNGTYIIGDVIVERYIPGKRAFRFLAHPFSASIALSQLADDIDITGSGGSTNGFTTSVSNNPSAFWYDQSLGDTVTVGYNSGWIPFTNTNGTGVNSWDRYEGLRVMCRGSIGQGLQNSSYTPDSVVLDFKGSVNQCSQVESFTKGANTDFIIASNPYPCQVDLSGVVRTNIGSSFWVWDATVGVKGAYQAYSYASSYILPSCASFATTVTSSAGAITFNESDKSSSSPSAVFKKTNASNDIELKIYGNDIYWDRTLISFDDNSLDIKDLNDAVKLTNPDLDLYSYSTDNKRLSIDKRPYSDSINVTVGVNTKIYGEYTFKFGCDLTVDDHVFFIDRLNKETHPLVSGFNYTFSINEYTRDLDSIRFVIYKGRLLQEESPNDIFLVYPNPAKSQLNVSIGDDESAVIKIYDIAGTLIMTKKILGHSQINLQNIAAGFYMLDIITNDGMRKKIKFIKH